MAHFCSRLEIVLGAFKLKPVLVTHESTCLYTQQSIVCLMVTLIHIMRVVGSNQRCANFARNFYKLRIGAYLIRKSMVLQFNKEIPFAKNFLETARFFQCTFFITAQ